MLIDIREVKRCRNGAYGNILPRGKGKHRYWVITINMAKNKTIADWATTLLHELLHAWVTALRLRGVKISNLSEHRFIYKVEEKILGTCRYLKSKRKVKKK
jgi:hypothetical protein